MVQGTVLKYKGRKTEKLDPGFPGSDRTNPTAWTPTVLSWDAANGATVRVDVDELPLGLSSADEPPAARTVMLVGLKPDGSVSLIESYVPDADLAALQTLVGLSSNSPVVREEWRALQRLRVEGDRSTVEYQEPMIGMPICVVCILRGRTEVSGRRAVKVTVSARQMNPHQLWRFDNFAFQGWRSERTLICDQATGHVLREASRETVTVFEVGHPLPPPVHVPGTPYSAAGQKTPLMEIELDVARSNLRSGP